MEREAGDKWEQETRGYLFKGQRESMDKEGSRNKAKENGKIQDYVSRSNLSYSDNCTPSWILLFAQNRRAKVDYPDL